MDLEFEGHDNPLDYSIEDEGFYESSPYKKSKFERRVTFSKDVYSKVSNFKYMLSGTFILINSLLNLTFFRDFTIFVRKL